MNKIAERFSKLLERNNFPMQIIQKQEKGNDTVFAFGQRIKESEVTVVIDFDIDNTCIDLNVFNLVKVENEENKVKVLKVLNDFNCRFRFPTFYINKEDTVVAQITIPYEKEPSEDMIFDMLRSLMTFCNNVIDDIKNA